MRRLQEQDRKHTYLIGFSGSGKSTIGAKLAARLNCRFIDTDSEIAARLKASIASVFGKQGERAFRLKETLALRKVAALESPAVVALGGGAIERPINRHLMEQSGVVIYLRCSLRELCRRLRYVDDRPLLRGGKSRTAAIREFLIRRKPIYEKADITVSTTHHRVGVVVEKIAEQLTKYERTHRR